MEICKCGSESDFYYLGDHLCQACWEGISERNGIVGSVKQEDFIKAELRNLRLV